MVFAERQIWKNHLIVAVFIQEEHLGFLSSLVIIFYVFCGYFH